MNRIGWFLLIVFVALTIGFVLMLRGEAPDEPAQKDVPAAKVVEEIGTVVMPVAGIKPQQLTDSWGDSRGDGSRRHNAIDIMAPRGTPVVASAPGTVEKLFDSRNGGRTIYVRSADGRTVYYYAHLDTYRAGLAEGQRVRTGEVIGTVGSTGSAGPDAPHLHFEIKRMAKGERWHQGTEVNPYPLLAGEPARR